jgi:hypothetical protein
VAQDLAGRVVDVVVERVAGVGHLGLPVVALGRPELCLIDVSHSPRLAVGEHRRPGDGAVAIALAGIRGLLVEEVDRLLARAEEDRAVVGARARYLGAGGWLRRRLVAGLLAGRLRRLVLDGLGSRRRAAVRGVLVVIAAGGDRERRDREDEEEDQLAVDVDGLPVADRDTLPGLA